MFSPRITPLARAFNAEFNGMTLSPATADDLETARARLITDLRVLLTDRDREFLLSVKKSTPNWMLFAHPQAERLPAVQWKLQNIARIAPEKRNAAISRLEAVLRAGET
jgi:hypothetical protein